MFSFPKKRGGIFVIYMEIYLKSKVMMDSFSGCHICLYTETPHFRGVRYFLQTVWNCIFQAKVTTKRQNNHYIVFNFTNLQGNCVEPLEDFRSKRINILYICPPGNISGGRRKGN